MKRIAAALLSLALLLPLSPGPAAAASAPAGLTVPTAVLMEKSTGKVLYEQDATTQYEPASVTKVMTMLLVMEAIDSGALHWDGHGHRLRPRLLHGRQPDLAGGE